MFQVASHPVSFDTSSSMRGHARYEQMPVSAHSASSNKISLPRTLSRPQFTEVSSRAMAAASPDLANVPAEYVRRGLREKASSMMAGLSEMRHMQGTMPKSQIPPSVSVALRAPSSRSSYPTHVLAIATAGTSSSDPKHTLIPVHAVTLAAHCAKLPALPPSNARVSGNNMQLPVLPLSLPSPAAFSILHTFMYTHRLDGVLKALLPLPTQFLEGLSHHGVRQALASSTTLHQLSSFVCASSNGNLQTITGHAAHVKEIWQDMVSLGLYDPELWDAIDLAWEIILGALNLGAAASK